jgi:hypothetical protein
MPLVLKLSHIDIDDKIPDIIKNEASRFYLLIHSYYLSVNYDGENGDKVLGKILNIKNGKASLKSFENNQVKFYLYKKGDFDYLYISKENWEEFRDYGLIGLFKISVSLYALIKKDDKYISIYPKNDVFYEE